MGAALRAAALAIGILAGCKPPVDEVAAKIAVDAESGALTYGGEAYKAAFADAYDFEGAVRVVTRVYNEDFPFFTHDLALGTEDYADPAKVEISARGGGNYYWRSKIKPEGSLIFLHVIPASLDLGRTLERLKLGQRVAVSGWSEAHSRVERADGNWIALGHANHKFVVLEQLSVR